MLRKIDDFLKIWEYESEATLKVFKNITNETLNKNVPGYERTLGFIAWHLTVWMGAISEQTGLSIDCPEYDSEQPANISAIIETYKNASGKLANEIKSNWTDADLLKENDVYGKIWKNSKTLASIVSHQTHHRAQMTVLMRILGLSVPGVYGPAKEEWEMFSMETQK